MALCFLAILLLTLSSALKLFRPGASPDEKTKAWLDGILTWGWLALITGTVGFFVGIVLMFQGWEAAGRFVSTGAAHGIKVSLLSAIFGTMFLGFATFFWWIMQLKWRLLKAAVGGEEG
jgi:hypothetical protein